MLCGSRNDIELVVVIDDIVINPRTKVLTESRAGSAGFVGEGMEAMSKVVDGEKEGEKVSYDSDGMYVGGMLRGGYKVGVSDKFRITVNGRVMLTYEGNKEVKLSTKDKIR